MKLSTSITTLFVVAACAAPPQTASMSFEEARKACFDATVAGVTTARGEEVKASIGVDGSFRGAVYKGGFLRREISGAPYDACMADSLGDMARGNKVEVADGILLTPDEKLAWDQMTPEERERVRLFMINGGTFASAAGSDA